VLFGVTVRRHHTQRALAHLQPQHRQIDLSFGMPRLPLLLLLNTPRVIHYVRVLITRVLATRAFTRSRQVFVEAGVEVLERAHEFAVGWEARCMSFPFFSLLC